MIHFRQGQITFKIIVKSNIFVHSHISKTKSVKMVHCWSWCETDYLYKALEHRL